MAITKVDPRSGTFAAPRYFIPHTSTFYKPARNIFEELNWPDGRLRADAYEHRFNAFCSILEAAVKDSDWTIHTILNKSHYDVNKWPVPYRAMKAVIDTLQDHHWLEKCGKRVQYRNQRFFVPPSSPMRQVTKVKVKELYWEPPVVSIRRGNTDLDRAPLDVELMANKNWKAWIKKYLVPKMEELNDKLLDHAFTFFPFGKEDDHIQPQYQRIYTNIEGFGKSPFFAHGRLYPRNFTFPSKERGWRQMTLIDGSPSVEVDVHASSLVLLAADGKYGFELPDTDDFYQYGALNELNRKLTKTVIQAVINGVSLERKTWPKSFREDKKLAELIVDENWLSYAEAIKDVYPRLNELEHDYGVMLMLAESNIILDSMLSLLDVGVGCLSIHDCLIVPEENVEEAKEAFRRSYSERGISPPKLSVQ